MAKYIASKIARRYDLASEATAATLDLSQSQVFEITNDTLMTLEFVNLPPTGRAQAIVVDVQGAAGVSFTVPAGITLTWNEGAQPDLGASWTQFTFILTGTRMRGGKGYSA